jgi:cytochrome P450
LIRILTDLKIAGIERLAIRSTTMPNGMRIPRGSKIAVDSRDMWSSDVHENPEVIDGFRFLRMRESGGKRSSTSSFVASHKELNVFGAGRSMCPGRFFAANQVKIALAHVLVKYDVQLEDGKSPKDLRVGFFALTDPSVMVKV